MINERLVTTKELESTIGRLAQILMRIPFVHHFLSRLCKLHLHSKRNNRRRTQIPQLCTDELKLTKTCFLGHSQQGISMNEIPYQKLTHVYCSDSCPASMGGYSQEGFAWQFYLPNKLQFCASDNLLEHLTGTISPWVDILAGRLKEGDCALSMTNSTTSEGWTWKTNFIEEMYHVQATVRTEVMRSHATKYMNNGIREYSQWFLESQNNMADALSRDMDRTDAELTRILFTHVPSQIASTFKIVPLPNKIICLVTLLLQKLPVQKGYGRGGTDKNFEK
jgi:hypothetical protein